MFNPVYFYNHGKVRNTPTVFMVDTTKTSIGSSDNKSILIPFGGGAFKCTVDWGDGIVEVLEFANNSNLTHTYALSGVYTVRVFVNNSYFFQIYFYGHKDVNKIGKFINWGSRFLLRENAFYEALNLNLSEVEGIPYINNNLTSVFYKSSISTIKNFDKWDLTNCTLLDTAFRECPNFNSKPPANVQNVLSMRDTFYSGSSFNQDISHLNFNKNVRLDIVLGNKTVASYNPVYYSNLLIKLASVMIGVGRTQTKTLNMGPIKYTSAGSSARAALVADGWTITDGGMI